MQQVFSNIDIAIRSFLTVLFNWLHKFRVLSFFFQHEGEK